MLKKKEFNHKIVNPNVHMNLTIKYTEKLFYNEHSEAYSGTSLKRQKFKKNR